MNKKCVLCGIEKSLDEFNHNGHTEDRKTSTCRVCLSKTHLPASKIKAKRYEDYLREADLLDWFYKRKRIGDIVDN